jgi:Putative prokaryotic signal transducing protein
MKNILSVTNSAEAHLLVEALHQEGIAASVQGEWSSLEGPSVWIENDTDADRANTLVAEMMAKQRPAPTGVQPRNRMVSWTMGPLRKRESGRTQLTLSNDRVADRRAFYRAGRKLREEYDRDRDGVFEQTVLFDEFEREASRR